MDNQTPEVYRILLIDDQPLTEKLIRRILRDAPDLELHYCQQPENAMQAVLKVRPVVILLDLNMPHIDGMVLLQMFRNSRLTEALPIIILTTEEDPFTRAEGFAYGASNYLIKLPDKVEMVARLRYHASSFVRRRRQSEKFETCADILHAEKQGYVLMDSNNHQIFDANDIICGVLGTPRRSLIGKIPFDLVSEEDHKPLKSALDWIPRKDKRIYEFYLINAQGKKIYTQCCISTTTNIMGRASVTTFTFVNPVKWELTATDQTSRFRIHADSIPNLIWLCDANANRYFFNKCWLDYTGNVMESEMDGGWKTSIHPGDLEKLEAEIAKAFSERERYSCKYRLQARDGSYRWMHETGVPFFNRDWEFLGYSGSCVDASEQILVEERLAKIDTDLERRIYIKTKLLEKEIEDRRRAQEKEGQTLQTQNIIIRLLGIALEAKPLEEQLNESLKLIISIPWGFLKDFGSIFLADNTAKKLTCVAWTGSEESWTAPCADIPFGYCLCGQAALSNKVILAFDKDPQHVVRHDNTPPHGHYCVPIRSGEQLLGVLSLYIKTDYQHDPVHEEFLLAIANTLATLIERSQIESWQRDKVAAETANRTKSQFLARMSHEIRTPLNAIMGLTDMALRTDLPAKARDHLTKVVSASNTLLRIINDILDLSKIEADRLELTKIEFHLRDVLDNMVELFRPKLVEKNIEFILHIAEAHNLTVTGDSFRFEQILMNLIGNAIKFTSAGEIELGVHPTNMTEERVELNIRVRDTGIGIAPEKMERLFQPFDRLEMDTQDNQGTGLGLVISKRLVEMMGGSIRVESRPNSGSTFSFTIPFIRRMEREKRDLMLPDDLQRIRTLVVDDNTANLTAFQDLMRVLNLDVQGVNSGERALLTYRQSLEKERPFQLVLVDWLMPGMDGEETALLIKDALNKHSTKHDPPKIIQLIPFGLEEGIKSRAREAGVDGFVSKPATISQIFDSIVEVFDKTIAPIYQPSKVFIDYEKITREVGGARILLVEDNMINQVVATEIIQDVGIWVETANNGEEALTILERSTFDLVLMDIQMPGMGGFETTRRIRSDNRFQKLPIIAMTAHAVEGYRQRCLDVGMNDHISKPVRRQTLYEVLAQWLPERKQKAIPPPTTSAVKPAGPSPPSELPLDLPGFQIAEALERLGGKVWLLKNLLLELRRDYADGARKIRKIMQNRDPNGLKGAHHLVHTIKGVAAAVSAVRLRDSAARLEEALEEKETDDFPALITEFEKTLQETVKTIDGLQIKKRTTIPEDDETDRGKIGTTDIKAAIQELTELVERQNYKSKMVFARISPLLTNPEIRETTERLESCLGRYDFRNAKIHLKTLATVFGVSRG